MQPGNSMQRLDDAAGQLNSMLELIKNGRQTVRYVAPRAFEEGRSFQRRFGKVELPPEVIEMLGFYVYTLAAPGTQKPFYVGKGTGNRVFAHATAALKSPAESDKLSQIREILNAGQQVQYEIVRHGLSEDQALEIEATLIDYLGLDSLTNLVAGQDMADRGRMTVNEIIAQYAAKPVTIEEPALLIIINRLFRRNMTAAQLYDSTRGDWVLGNRRNRARFAFAVYHGVVREVCRIEKWTSVTTKGERAKRKDRWQFTGSVATDLRHYVNGKVTSYIKKGSQSPVLYINC
jgi:hypothetical protein